MKNQVVLHKGHSIEPYPVLYVPLSIVVSNGILFFFIGINLVFLLVSFFVFCFLYIYIYIRYYVIYEHEIVVKNFNRKILFRIPYESIQYVYYYDRDKMTNAWSMNARLFDHNNKLVFTLTFSEPDGEDFIKVIKHIQSKGVKVKIDKRTKYEPILKAFGKLK
jgi:hypothetical protein